MIKNLDIVEKGYYEVIVDGVAVSQHTKAVKAGIRSLEEHAKNKNAVVRVRQPELQPIVDIESVAEDISILEARITELEAENSTLTSSNTTLVNSNTELNTEIEILLAEVERLKAIIDGNVIDEPTLVKAFPTAIGAGAYTTGGRGGTVYHVTNLTDFGEGSFRDAVSQPNRIIVFDVSGEIVLQSILGLSSNITIAGQTAPEGGITITGDRIFVGNVNNIIVRYIRFKNGVDGSNDSVTVRDGAVKHIWDHCTFSFGVDEGASWYEASAAGKLMDSITIQRCLFSDNSKASILGAASPAIAGDFTMAFNLFYNSRYRFPNVVGQETSYFDVINNVIWGVGSRLIRGNEGFNLNHIGNYIDYGLGINLNNRMNSFAAYDTKIPQIYTVNNKYLGKNEGGDYTYSQINTDNKLAWKWFTTSDLKVEGELLPNTHFTDTQHALRGESFNILTPDNALNTIKNDVGCNNRLNADGSVSNNLDVEDTISLSNVNNGTHVTPLGTVDWKITPIVSVSRQSGYYVNSPDIPEAWFSTHVPSGQTSTDIAPNGYTWLENYINGVD
jgi:hypothetical protein